MFKTLNNETSRRVLIHALHGKYRFCAYSLYNYRDIAFVPATYKRLFALVVEFLGSEWTSMITGEDIDWCVRDYIRRYYENNF